MKRKQTQARVTAVITACFLALLALLFACLLAFVLPQAPRYPEALQTAEYLALFTAQTPAYLQLDTGCLNSRHCFTIFLANFPAMSNQQRYLMTRTLILTIDGDVQRNYYASLLEGNIYAEIPPLSGGLHLLQVEIQDKNKRLYRHQWVLQIEGNGDIAPTQALPPTPLMNNP